MDTLDSGLLDVGDHGSRATAGEIGNVFYPLFFQKIGNTVARKHLFLKFDVNLGSLLHLRSRSQFVNNHLFFLLSHSDSPYFI